MPSIFISYARVSQQFATRLARSLETAGADVFLDVDDIPAGSNWSNTIQRGLDTGQVMIVIITPESMSSQNVSEEWQYFLDEGKPIIPLLLQPTRVHFQLRRLQYIDFYEQDYDRALRQLLRSLARSGVRLQMPPITPSAGEIADEIAEARAAFRQHANRRTPLLIGAFVLALLLLVGILLVPTLLNNSQPTSSAALSTATETPTLSALEIAQVTITAIRREATLTALTATRQARIDAALTEIVLTELATFGTATPTLTETSRPTDTPDFTDTPSPTSTLTQSPSPTPTLTPVPPTDTSTPTNTPTFIPTSTITRTPTPTRTLTPVPPTDIPSPTPIPVGFTGNPVTSNAQWQPALKTFDDVEMVLVPAGCLRQGNPCFEQPFWIDRYEVSNAQFQSNSGRTSFNRASWNNGSDHPREYIYWSEAQAYCQQRGGRLPTGAEWEYAARGPDNLEYPWGNSFVANNAVYSENARGTTAPVGSRPGGASWVGAEDMSGNVWEWVDETAQNGSKANRGGSFDYWRDQQTTTASKANADSTANFNIGLRCMRDFNPDDLA